MMSDAIRICTDRVLSNDQIYVAAQAALTENPDNLPVLPRSGAAHARDALEISLLTSTMWASGRKLTVSFLDGVPEVQSKVEQFAHQWSQFANISFDFGSHATADIRISFSPGGSWSYLGTDALSIAANEQTMNFGWLTPSSSEDEISRVVLHEFGHALGAIHEHQNPNVSIPWDKPAVYAYYSGPPNNWTTAQVDNNIFAKYSHAQTNSSQFDAASIMLYAIPNSLTLGDWEVGWNRTLSPTDQSFIAGAYPGAAAGPVELQVAPPWTQAAIGAAGEKDLFTFEVGSAGWHTIQTSGTTDVVLQLLGPDSQTTLVAQDDDSGGLRNARIRAQLAPGRYYTRVRHFGEAGTGAYEIAVRQS